MENLKPYTEGRSFLQKLLEVDTVYSGTLKLDLNLILLESSNDLWIAKKLKMEENIELTAGAVMGFIQ